MNHSLVDYTDNQLLVILIFENAFPIKRKLPYLCAFNSFMENIHAIDLIKKNLFPGLKFKSGRNHYEILSFNKYEVFINYFDAYTNIPFELFAKVIQKENPELINLWNHKEIIFSEDQ